MDPIDIERLKAVIHDNGLRPRGGRDIRVTDRFYDDLGADSMDMWDLVIAIEVAFKVNLPLDREKLPRDVQDLIALVERGDKWP